MRRMSGIILPLLLVAPSLVAMIFTSPVGAISAQNAGVTVYLQPVNMADGSSITDACFVIVNASNEGCDENGDGYISFEGIAPGSYLVSETRSAAGYLPVGDVRISVNQTQSEQTFQIGMLQQTNANVSSVDISLVPTDVRTGNALPGACFIIATVSNEGCDENNDGQVTFDGIPVGTYRVTQTTAPTGYDVEPAQWMVIERNGPIIFLQGNPSAKTSNKHATLVHVALDTRDPQNGELLTGACYVHQRCQFRRL